MTNTLSGKQCALFCSIMIFSSKLLVLPSLLYSSNSTAGILSVLLIFLLEFVFNTIKHSANRVSRILYAFFENVLEAFNFQTPVNFDSVLFEGAVNGNVAIEDVPEVFV